MKIGPLLRVTWNDSFVDGPNRSWNDDEDLTEFLAGREFRVETVGWKVGEDDDHLTLASSVAREAGPQVASLTKIPKGCIVRRQRIGP